MSARHGARPRACPSSSPLRPRTSRRRPCGEDRATDRAVEEGAEIVITDAIEIVLEARERVLALEAEPAVDDRSHARDVGIRRSAERVEIGARLRARRGAARVLRRVEHGRREERFRDAPVAVVLCPQASSEHRRIEPVRGERSATNRRYFGEQPSRRRAGQLQRAGQHTRRGAELLVVLRHERTHRIVRKERRAERTRVLGVAHEEREQRLFAERRRGLRGLIHDARGERAREELVCELEVVGRGEREADQRARRVVQPSPCRRRAPDALHVGQEREGLAIERRIVHRRRRERRERERRADRRDPIDEELFRDRIGRVQRERPDDLPPVVDHEPAGRRGRRGDARLAPRGGGQEVVHLGDGAHDPPIRRRRLARGDRGARFRERGQRQRVRLRLRPRGARRETRREHEPKSLLNAAREAHQPPPLGVTRTTSSTVVTPAITLSKPARRSEGTFRLRMTSR